MATVTVKDDATPSQQLVADAKRVVRVTDALGRSIGIRKVTATIRRRVSLAVSGENQNKPMYMGQVMLAASVCEIDGEPIGLPGSDEQFWALIDRLDDEGMLAVGTAYKDNFLPREDGAARAGE